MPYQMDLVVQNFQNISLEKVEWQEWSRARFQLWRDAAMLNPRRNSIIILHIYISIYIYTTTMYQCTTDAVRMATNDAADMCLSMKIPLLSLKVEDKDVRDHFDIMHLAKDGKKHLENNGNKYLNNNVHT